MHTGSHINFFCEEAQFSYSQSIGRNCDCIMPLNRTDVDKACSIVMSRLVISVVLTFLSSLIDAGLV